MPNFHVSPISIVNQIKSNLQDRYDSGYPILKELLQNADDGKAHNFRLDALQGWPNAANPLLRGPGLLVVNDGVFKKEDERGIASFGESAKATDSGVIGKFGFGQKAVFHLCDAFIVYAYGNDKPFSTVVNPFLGVEVDGNIAEDWEPPSKNGLIETDLTILRDEISADFEHRYVALWLPFRSEELRPAPDLGFSTNFPSASQTISDLARPDDLRVLLTALRHLKSIEIREHREPRWAIGIRDAQERLLGPREWLSGARSFGGAIDTHPDHLVSRFVGREATIQKGRLAHLRRSPHWPRTISVLSPKPQPEKGEPHGAATLLHDAKSSQSQLRISWAVFLPISENTDITIPIDDASIGQFRLLLHGYFFLDSGRRQIEGLLLPAESGEAADAAELRCAWNAELRDSIVLPLVPDVLRGALDTKMVASEELGHLVAAISKSSWFHGYRDAICKENSLVRALETPRRIIWRLVPPDAILRPLPKAVADAPERISELFVDLHSWAKTHGILLCVDRGASLAAKPMRWTAADLGSLFSLLSPRGFQSGALAPLLANFLDSVHAEDTYRQQVGPHLVSGLRNAMIENTALGASEQLSAILAHVPHRLIFPLPTPIEHRQILRALASASADVLPVRSAWLKGDQLHPRLSDSDLKALLTALEPHIGAERNADQAATATLAMLMHAESGISDLANHPDYASIKVLRARDLRTGSFAALSLLAIYERSQEGLLFTSSPEANRVLPLVAEALPDANPMIVEGRTAEFLRSTDNSTLKVQIAGKKSIFSLINSALRFGQAGARARLLDGLPPAADDDRAALRRLCAGKYGAGNLDADIWVLEGTPEGIEKIVTTILNQSENDFLIPKKIADELTPKRRNFLGVKSFDTTRLEALLEKNVEAIAKLEPTQQERAAFLTTNLSDNLLRRLPIHLRSDGKVGDAKSIFWEADWPIPATMRKCVLTAQPSSNAQVFERQQRLIINWSPRSQLEIALSQNEPQQFWEEILGALAESYTGELELEEHLIEQLRTTSWLIVDERPVAPNDVLALPATVDAAARAILLKDGEEPPFLPVGKLTPDVKEHPGFVPLEKWVLPSQHWSIDALSLMIQESEIIGRLGTTDGFPVKDFTSLAKNGIDLPLPGWPLMAAALATMEDEPEYALKILDAFSGIEASNPNLAANFLDALAAIADGQGQVAEVARRAYRNSFEVVAEWTEEQRRGVFSGTRVPNDAGGWLSGCEVIEDGDGVANTHLLARDYASILRRQHSHHDQALEVELHDVNLTIAHRRRGEIFDVDLRKIESESVAEQREFLKAWQGHIPSDLVIIYIGLIGRFADLKQLANEWVADATADVETLWADLDAHFPRQVLYPLSLPDEIEQRRFKIQQIGSQQVRATAMSGDLFDAPLGSATDGIIIGNLHQTSEGIRAADDGLIRSLITLPLRQIDPGTYGQKDACAIFRQFVEIVASKCLLLGMARQLAALTDILDKAVEVDQSTLEETERKLRDRLPMILAELKLPTSYRAQKALTRYNQAETRHHRLSRSAQDLETLKTNLWQTISDPEVADEMLFAVRNKISDFGYSATRVLFELFQNADDAYAQQDSTQEDSSFKVEVMSEGSGGFRVTHWGRAINHLGSNADEGRRLGYDHDLLNMLLMNFSEKRQEDDLTGKFGLGFKSVHVLSDSVGIASRFIAIRTLGGFIPAPWASGIAKAESRKLSDGRKATIIDVPFSEDAAGQGKEAVEAFRSAMAWLPAFARSVRRIELVDDDLESFECSGTPLFDESTINVVNINGACMQRALRFDLSDRYSLLLKIHGNGPSAFPCELRRLWNLAPLEEDLRSGWLLNGPFPVDPGRGRISGSIDDRQERFRKLGSVFGERLLELYDLSLGDWKGLADALDLDASEQVAKTIFWSHLFDVIELDFDDDLARYIHAEGAGYGRLANERPVVPTRLGKPLDGIVQASDVVHFADGALSLPGFLEKLWDWQFLSDLKGKIVASDVAGQLRKLGFGGIRPIKLSNLLRGEIGSEKRIDPDLAKKIGNVVTPKTIREIPLVQELTDILTVAKETQFLSQGGSWRTAQLPYPAAADDEEETRLCAFAPAKHLLDDQYSGSALNFFRVAREQSGFGPQARDLANWAAEASEQKRQAALRYVIEGRQGYQLGDALRQNHPTWLPWPASQLREDELLSGWTETEKDDLLYALGGRSVFSPEFQPPPPLAEPTTVLVAIYDWWASNRTELRKSYADRLYPTFFSTSQLTESDDRVAWFTMFSLACFHSFGRTQEGQHRNFVQAGWQEGWWQDLAGSRPPGDVQSWLDRLDQWSAPEQFDQSYLPWRRTLVDLYTVARWLDEYQEIILKLPRIIEDHGVISLDGALQPSYWPPAMRLCIDAAPLNRSLGIGMNWLLREMLREGVYEPSDEYLIEPYCWAPSYRVRELLNALGADIGAQADKEVSRQIFEFVAEHIGKDRARFNGDFDLPLQLITRETHRASLDHCFELADHETPSFADADDDSE